MKTKLLKKLRKEIMDNANIHYYSSWSGYLTTKLKGVEYYGRDHSTIGFSINAEPIGKELEHVALKGYIKQRKRNKQ